MDSIVNIFFLLFQQKLWLNPYSHNQKWFLTLKLFQ
nr:MAG TPA: hypothetical protein [Caudoviricetes sp.]DAL79162.1 MAG TPA: hypothetical protein [Caudoviricetes sp.]